MIGKKINQLATELSPLATDLTIIGDPTTGVSKKITLEQISSLFGGSVSFYTNFASFPAVGNIDIIYCAKDTNKLYLWSGSAYTEVFPSQALLDTYQLRSEKGNANGYASLDSLGKVPISQLPSSIMEYKGTWSAATNTPTLANGTGDTGDVYLCNAAGSVNFGAGAISFAVGDYVVYSGTIWQRSSGAVGTVTSVAISRSGDALAITGSPITTSGTINLGFAGNSTQYINGAGSLNTFPTLLSSVGLSMPSAFSVANSPLTANGTIAVTGAGNATQYVRGDGQLATLPTNGGGGGASVSYYLNGSVNQGTIGGVTYYEMNKTPIIGAGTDFSRSTNGYIASFLTDANDPALLNIPAGNWNFETYFQASSGGGSPTFYIELYKYDGTTFTLIASNSATPKLINDGANIEAYFSALAVPQTTLTLTDRLAVRIYVTTAGRTITLHTENGHLCQVITTFTTGLTALNGLTSQVQYLATGTSGTDFNISSATATHTFNLPTASATNRGALSSTDWTTFNSKQNALSGTGFVKISGTTISYDNSTYYLASNPNSYIALTNLSAGAGISYNNTTGVIASTITQYTDALARAAISLTTTGTSGAATYNSTTGVLNVPQYAPDLSGYVPTNRTLTINGTAYDLSANRSWSVGTVTSVGLSSATSGVTIGSTPITTSGTITLAIATASGSQQGLLSSTDWTTFNNKQSALTNPVTGTGTTNYLPKFTGTSTIGNSIITDDGTSVVINGSSTTYFKVKASTNSGIDLLQDTGGNGYLVNRDNGFIFFATNNTERMRLNASGNLSIGNTNDTYKLDVSGTGRFTGAVTIGASNFLSTTNLGTSAAYMTIQNSGGTTYIGRENSTGTNFGATAYSTFIFSGGAYPLEFFTNSTKQLSIASTGAATFSSSITSLINTAGVQNQLILENLSAAAGADGNIIYFKGYQGSLAKISAFGYPQDQVGGYLQLQSYNDNTTANTGLIINNVGNVGIGTTSPANTLHVAGVGRIDTGLYFVNGGTGGAFVWNIANESLRFGTNDTERMRITSGGDVGIGTTPNTNYILDVLASKDVRFKGATNYMSLVLDNSSTTGGGGINFKNNGTTGGGIGNSGWWLGDTSNDLFLVSDTSKNIRFAVNGGTEAMRITSGGNVGIGVTNPTEKLEVNGSIKTSAPFLGTAKPWKLGAVYTGTCVPTSWGEFASWATGMVIEVEIDGSTYRIPIVVDNYC